MYSGRAVRLVMQTALAASLGCTAPSLGGGAPRPSPTAGTSGGGPPAPSPMAGAGGSAPAPAGGAGGSGGSVTGGSGGQVTPPATDANIPVPSTDAGPGGVADAAGDGGDGPPPVGPPPPPPPPFRAPGVVAYWGQNSYSRRTTDKLKYEKDLATTCRENPHYEALVVAFVSRFIPPVDMTSMPLVNFSNHCNNKYAFAQCDDIGRGINECQSLGKKVILSLGGAIGGYGFSSDDQARQFAQTTWDLFLNGQSTYRPFRTAVVDGIDLDIEGGSPAGYSAYVRKLRELMNTDKSRKYYITAAPQCPFPDAYLGPGAGKALGDTANLFDYLFVQFYNNFCFTGSGDIFRSALAQWTKVAGPKIFIGMPA
jgi:hypothetical protein